jgi:hypothetical protein
MSRGRFYIRAESDERDFIRSLQTPAPFDAAVISDRYLAEYPAEHPRYGQPRDQLLQAFDSLGVPWSVDPDTARLGHRKSTTRQKPRAANRPLARAVALPLSAERLSREDHLDALVEAASIHQLPSRAFAAPYLEVDDLDDPRLAVNLRLLERSRQLAGDRALIAYLQVLQRRLADGTAAEIARGLATRGADVVFIRVRRLDPERATPDEVAAYGRLVMAGEQAGARIVADCVGRLGPVLVAAGADGFASNAWRFRKVPDDLHPAGGGGGVGELVWEIPGGGFSSVGAHTQVTCAVPGCAAPAADGDNIAVRIHNLHEFQRAARLAAAQGLGYAARLARNPSPVVRGWARALQSLERRAA